MDVADVLRVLVLTWTVAVCDDNVNGELRLSTDSQQRHRLQGIGGRVEIHHGSYDGEWGTIEYSSAINQSGVGQVVCRQLDYYGYVRVGTVDMLNYPEADSDTPVILQHVDCPYNADPGNALQHILRCKHEHVPSAVTPDHSLDLAVECTHLSRDVDPYDTQIRLLQGDGTASGFVEVYLNRRWGPVCYMGGVDANVACRQLGYTDAYSHDKTKDGLVTIHEEQVSDFTCDDDDNSYQACLHNCFKYPKANFSSADCPDGFSYIVCEYEEHSDYFNGYGSKSLCTSSSLSNGAVLAIIMGALVLSILLCVAMVAGCLCCCCLPAGICYNVGRKKSTYEVIQ